MHRSTLFRDEIHYANDICPSSWVQARAFTMAELQLIVWSAGGGALLLVVDCTLAPSSTLSIGPSPWISLLRQCQIGCLSACVSLETCLGKPRSVSLQNSTTTRNQGKKRSALRAEVRLVLIFACPSRSDLSQEQRLGRVGACARAIARLLGSGKDP